jgi:oligopeptide/dipeptide ABC transporter ATP-binding protein
MPPAGSAVNHCGAKPYCRLLFAGQEQLTLFINADVTMPNPLLQVENLKMYFPIRGGILRRKVGQVHAVDDVSMHVDAGETLGLVGESGCGKTTVGRSIIRLYKPSAGRVLFNGSDVLGMGRNKLRQTRRNLQMMFQDPFESLNARHTVGEILEEPFIIHHAGSGSHRREEVLKLLDRVGLPADAIHRFPHEFSGGQRQRIGIARAIALRPKLIICDEPVSALDVSIQSQILNLLLDLQKALSLSYLFIAHDLAVVKHISDRIAVMYLGKIVERAKADDLYAKPLHPYTQALISAIPIPDPNRRKEMKTLHGDVPSPIHPPPGCRFHTRCPYVIPQCKIEEPKLESKTMVSNHQDHLVACHRVGDI